MYNSENLNLNSDLLKGLRSEIEVSINAALMLASKEGKEGEITVKLKVKTETARKYEKGKVCKEWTEPRLSWKVTRKAKENKIDHEGTMMPGWELHFDEDGRPYVVEANQQTSMFDEEKDAKTVIHYHFGEKKDPEVNEDANVADTTLDDDAGDAGDSEAEQSDELPEADDAEGAQ